MSRVPTGKYVQYKLSVRKESGPKHQQRVTPGARKCAGYTPARQRLQSLASRVCWEVALTPCSAFPSLRSVRDGFGIPDRCPRRFGGSGECMPCPHGNAGS